MSSSKEDIGERLKQVRGKLTQREFGELLGFSHGFIGDIERGRSCPSIPLLVSLAVKCGVSLNWILTGEVTESRSDKDGGFRPASEEEALFAEALNALWEMFQEADPDVRAWMRVQLSRAIPEIAEVLSLKKQQAATTESA